MKKLKEKGITLIALVVTIVVLLILAGVTISMLTGENGIVNQAKNAKEESLKSELEELVDLTLMEYQTEKAAGKDSDLGELFNSKVEKDKIFESITDDGENYIVEKNGYEVTVSKDGERITDSEKVGGVRPKLEISSDFDEASERVTITVTITNLEELDTIENFKLFDSESNEIISTTSEMNIKTFEVTKNGKYKAVVEAITKGEKKIGQKVIEVNDYFSIEAGKYFEDDTIIRNDEGKAIISIPAGSTVSGIEGENELNKGIVIYITKGEKVTNWEIAKTIHDQFVWVPVKNAVLDLSGNSTALKSDENIKLEVQKEIEAGRYPMAIKKDETNYLGVLYKFTEKDESIGISPLTEWTPTGITGRREPAYLTDNTYGDENSANNITPKISESLLQEEFNTMVEKVSQKGGFWVGRYETSNMDSSNLNDLVNKIKVIKGTTKGIHNVNWYRMYAQQKNYSKLQFNAKTTSSMIWGSQWDQIMIWMKYVENTKNKTNGKYYITNAVGMGNFGTISGVDDGYTNTSEPAPTGCFEVKNIYDLAGNVFDWSIEAMTSQYRVPMGGYYNYNTSNLTKPIYRGGSSPIKGYVGFGSRVTIY